MPWKDLSPSKQRLSLVRAALAKHESISELAHRFGVSRKTAHKWISRHIESGLAGMEDRNRAPGRQSQQMPKALVERIVGLRHAHPSWGAKKLRTLLARELAPAALPAERTISRWLARCGLSRRPKHRARPGPQLPWPGLQTPQGPNDVWAADFKGAFRTGDGQRCEPLTVRDMFSRMVLAIEILPDCRHDTLRQAFLRLFKRFGLPGVMRVDNGQPFASSGPYGCSGLSLWWMRLGIEVNHTRLASPQDNGSHEQFHRVLKAETLRPPARSPRAQQRRQRQWLEHYNTERPHEAIGQKTPASLYQKSPRRYRPLARTFKYPARWKVYRVGPKGTIRWRGRIRLLSRILAHERVGLRPISQSAVAIYIEKLLVGHLHADDPAGMRPVTICKPGSQEIGDPGKDG
jgi:transposase InsO family protein